MPTGTAAALAPPTYAFPAGVTPAALAGSAVTVASGRDGGYTATLLQSGEVLIAGGAEHDSGASAEIFNPATGKTELPGYTLVPRTGSSATQLADGRILIAGGRSSEAAASAEIFDPSNGRFTVTGGLVEGRANHTAILLPGGKVLIAGGERYLAGRAEDENAEDDGNAARDASPAGVSLASAELYDPATGKFIAIGTLAAARSHHTATLLPDGRVLIAGGAGDSQQALSSAELYDPTAGKSSAVQSMLAKRSRHTATLLGNGKVLIAGGNKLANGRGEPDPEAQSSAPQANAELYDPASGQFRAAGQMSVMRSDHSATLLQNGMVLVAGGRDEGGNAMIVAELYDSLTGKFKPIDGLNAARCGHSATLLRNGTVLIAGGLDTDEMSGGLLNSSEIYDPSAGHFSVADTLAEGRSGHAALSLRNDKVLIIGGNAGVTELYDPASGKFTSSRIFPARSGASTATLLQDGRVLLAGGWTGEVVATAVIYDPNTRSFSRTGSMATSRQDAVATLLADGRVLISGGLGGKSGDFALDSAEVYDPGTGTFTPTGRLISARDTHGAALLPDGRVLIAGGIIVEHNHPGWGATDGPYIPGGPIDSAELYDPKTGKFSATASLSTLRGRIAATLLPDGKVLVPGGRGGSEYAADSADLYDPATGKFARLGKLTTGRADYTSILLPDGKVLLAGGYYSSADVRITPDAEVYDPASGASTAAFKLDEIGGIRTVMLLRDGKVLFIGKSGAMITDLARLLVAATSGGTPASAVSGVTVDAAAAPVTYMNAGAFRATGSLINAQSGHTATMLHNGEVLLIGDKYYGELYDPDSGKFARTGDQVSLRRHHTSTLLPNGKVLVTGGDHERQVLSSVESFDPRSKRFAIAGSLVSPRTGHSATLLPNGKVLVTGGAVSFGEGRKVGANIVGSAEIYDPDAGTSTPTASLSVARQWHTATLLPNGKVLVAGGMGISFHPLDTVELYDPSTGKFGETDKLSVARYGATATMLPDGKVLIYGGRGGANSYVIGDPEIYDPAKGTFTAVDSSAPSCEKGTATLLVDGRVLFAGGTDGVGGCRTAYLYDPVTQKGEVTAPLLQNRWNNSATLLSDGTVLIAGGDRGSSLGGDLDSAELFDPEAGAAVAYPYRPQKATVKDSWLTRAARWLGIKEEKR